MMKLFKTKNTYVHRKNLYSVPIYYHMEYFSHDANRRIPAFHSFISNGLQNIIQHVVQEQMTPPFCPKWPAPLLVELRKRLIVASEHCACVMVCLRLSVCDGVFEMFQNVPES